MRTATKRDLIATWFVADAAEDASVFPQSGHDSGRQEFQNIYWRCVLCFHLSAVRHAPGARHVLYTNCEQLPTVDGVPIGATLAEVGVEVRQLPIRRRLGRGKVATWNNQFYILDIIEELAQRGDYDTATVLDSDCLIVRPISSMLHDIDRRGVLSLSIPYTEEAETNGATRVDMQRAATQLAGLDLPFTPHYSGGEFFAASREWVGKIWALAAPMWETLAAASPGEIKVYEEAQFLSIIYEALDVPTGTADPHCRRMWTALRLNNVSAEDVWSSRCVWHLPMEKKTGFADLFKIASRRDSWLWEAPPEELFLRYADCMGLPRRKTRHMVKHFMARLGFHLERKPPVPRAQEDASAQAALATGAKLGPDAIRRT